MFILSRKTIFILAGVIGAGIVIFIVVALLSRPKMPVVPVAPTPTGLVTPGGLPLIGEGGPRPGVGGVGIIGGTSATPLPVVSPVANGGLTSVEAIVSESARFAQLSGAGELRYYSPNDGVFYRVDKNGNREKLTDSVFPTAREITWSPTGDRAVMRFPDGTVISYDFVHQNQVTFPRSWQDFSFDRSGTGMAFKIMADNPDKRWLAVAGPDGGGVKVLNPLGEEGDRVITSYSPDKRVAAFVTESLGLDRQRVLFLATGGENLKAMIVEGFGIKPQWSPNGQQLLYSVYQPSLETAYRPTLWVVDSSGDEIGKNRTALNLNTQADKCTFAPEGTSIFCAAPRTVPFGYGPNPETGDTVADDFWQINLVTGEHTRIARPADRDVTAYNLQVSNDGSELVFENRQTGGVDRIRLR